MIFNKGFKWHCFQILVALDQLGNAILGGWADETISARTYRNSQKGYWYARLFEKFLNCVFGMFGDKEHCKTAYESEINNAQLGKNYRNL